MANRDVSVILPTYNEEGTIRQTIARARQALSAVDHEVIVVDDDSPDGTAAAVRDVYGNCDAVQVIVRKDESGLSSAVLCGFDRSDGDLIAVMDADLQHPPNTLRKMLVLSESHDLVIGTRLAKGGSIEGDWPIHRRVISRGASLLAMLAVPQTRTISDPMSGFFVVDADIVESVRKQLRPHGYKILLELLARCPLEDDDITETGYAFQNRVEGTSNLGVREYGRYLVHLTRLTIPARRPSAGTRSIDVDQEVSER